MPIDRNPPSSLKPKLASNRTAKTPLTPRLAAAPAAASSRPARTSNGATPRVTTTAVVEDVTPVKPYLTSNITPRSSSRKSRVGVGSPTSTPNETPTSTPTSSRPASTVDFPSRDHSILYSGPGVVGNNGAQGAIRPRSTLGQPGGAPRLPLSNAYGTGQSLSGSTKDGSSMFFHASDARPQEPALTQKKGPVFFYADGKQDEPQRKISGPSPPPPTTASTVTKSQPESKFFHADSVAEVRTRSPVLTPPPTSTSPEPLNQNPPAPHGPSLRPPSPTKDWAHLSYRKGASQVIRPALVSRTSGMSMLSGPTTPEPVDNSRRRSSTASSIVRQGHMKSSSLSSIDSVTSLRKVTATDGPAMSPSPLHHENRVISNISIPDSTASAPSPPLAALSGLPSPGPASPTKPAGTQSALEAMNELAANARRERKVLDLEISNSSLLAINRSLEKEVRKQKAELRRFRRLSRAGRFSMDTVGSGADTFSPSGASHIADLSDMSEEEEEEIELPEEDPESSDSSFDEGQLSPTAQEAKDEAHRIKDEKRLQLDLSKHRELLIDSQKMNQSLKRCMNWTEQLIKDGQKALEYQVRVSDVKLGGRVLVSEDNHEDDHVEESKGLLSPWSPLHSAMDALDSPFFPGASRLVDRDSGVDIDGFETTSHDPSDNALLGSPFEERIKRLHASIEALENS